MAFNRDLSQLANFLEVNADGSFVSIIPSTSQANLGIGTSNPTSKLTVQGDGKFIGTVTADEFVGALTGLASSATQLEIGRTVAITGDLAYTSGSFDGTSNVTGTGTLATVNSNVGSFGSETLIPVVTVNAKGLITAVSTAAVGTALTVAGDSDSAVNIDLLTETLTVAGGTNITSVGAGNTLTINLDNDISLGIVTATEFKTGTSGAAIGINTNTISGPATLTIDPAAVGDDTGLVIIKGNLQIDGTTTTINSTTVTVDDKNIVLGSGAINDAAADGSGITIESGNGNKTFQFEDTGDNLGSSENLNVASGKVYKINNTEVLSATTLGSGVTNSSLTSVGTLTNLSVNNVTGVSTLGVTSTTNLTSQTLNVSGISTLGVTSTTDLTSQTLNVSGISTLGVTSTTDLTSQTLNVSGISTLGVTSTTNLTSQQLNVSGVSTVNNLNIDGYVSVGNTIGAVNQVIVSTGVGVTYKLIADLLPQTRTTQTFTATASQTVFNFAYNVNFLDVFVNGVKLSAGEFTAVNGTSITLSEGTFANDIVEFVSYATVASGTGQVNILNDLTDVTLSGIATGNILAYNGSEFVNTSTLSGITSIFVGGAVVGSATTFTEDLVVQGDARITGILTIGTASLTLDGVNNTIKIGTGITLSESGSANYSGTLTADSFVGSGYGLTATGAIVTNILYVTKDGSDTNTGTKLSVAKATIAGAIAAAGAGTVIKVSAGTYIENNPLIVPAQVSIIGDSLREVSVSPLNAGEDLFYVGNGDYIAEMSFTGSLNSGKAIFAFNPNIPEYNNQSPYIQNCTNFIPNSIGLKIDGSKSIGPTKSMVVDSYTQYNQGGIGVSITNEGYAQLVSLFTICNETAIFCGSGSACDLTNSNSSFGNYGLVADGIGPKKYTGIITTAADANSDTFVLDLNVPTLNVSSAVYNNVSGIVTVTTSSNHNFNVGMGVTISGLKFNCNSVNTVTNYNISTANYTNTTGILTVTTSTNHNFSVGISVTMSNLVFECNSGGGISTAFFPPAPGDNNGDSNYIFDVISLPASNQFVVNVGTSTITHSYVNGGVVSISTIANFPSGDYGYIFEVAAIGAANSFSAYVGVSTLSHTYNSGGTVKINATRPYDGQVVYFDELYYTVGDVTIGSGGTGYTQNVDITFSDPSEPWGITATAVGQVTNGSVTSVEMVSNGRGYTTAPTVTFASPNSGINTATGTANLIPTYYSILRSTPISGGICTITINDNVPYAVGLGSTVPFFKQSRVLASGHSLEYIGSGTNINSALPNQGGVTIQENEIDMRNGGLVIFTSTDQSGNFRIGDGVVINQQNGTVSGTSYTKSLFSTMTPFILALGGD
jgi:hypothetical protein